MALNESLHQTESWQLDSSINTANDGHQPWLRHEKMKNNIVKKGKTLIVSFFGI